MAIRRLCSRRRDSSGLRRCLPICEHKTDSGRPESVRFLADTFLGGYGTVDALRPRWLDWKFQLDMEACAVPQLFIKHPCPLRQQPASATVTLQCPRCQANRTANQARKYRPQPVRAKLALQ